LWATAGPKFANDTENNVSNPTLRYAIIDNFLALARFNLENLVRSDNTVATDQMIHYPPVSDASRYTFSLFAFPEEQYPAVLSDYFQFSRDYGARLPQSDASRRVWSVVRRLRKRATGRRSGRAHGGDGAAQIFKSRFR
ncbi:MAG: hypothetical protein ACREMY_29055, partial [bacterium]